MHVKGFTQDAEGGWHPGHFYLLLLLNDVKRGAEVLLNYHKKGREEASLFLELCRWRRIDMITVALSTVPCLVLV